MYNTSYQAASAVITGSEKYPDIRGLAVFVPTELGTMVSVSVYPSRRASANAAFSQCTFTRA